MARHAPDAPVQSPVAAPICVFTVKLHHAITTNIGFTPMSTCVCGGTDNAGREAIVEYTSEKDLIVARVFEYGLGIREAKCARYRGR